MPTPRAGLTISETCSCGAVFAVTEGDGARTGYAAILRDLRAWRRGHRHDLPQQGRMAKAIGFQQYGGRDDEDEDEGGARASGLLH